MNLNANLEKSLAGRWIAGYYPEDALKRTKLFNSKRISTIINFLGEDIHERKKINNTVKTYIWIINEIKNRRLKAGISVKPTQLGLNMGFQLMYSNYLKIVKQAKKSGVFIWFDMEGPESVDTTIRAYKRAMNNGNTGICIQAYLKRSQKDAENLLRSHAVIRLVKGAYKADAALSFKSKRDVNRNYLQIMRMLFSKSKKFMVATHDSKIIEEAIRLNRKYKRDVTFAMLNGIRNKYALHLSRTGQKVTVYVPFGEEWVSYGLRRLSEQGHLSLIVRSLLEKQEL